MVEVVVWPNKPRSIEVTRPRVCPRSRSALTLDTQGPVPRLVSDGLSWTQEQSLPVVRDMDIGYHFMLNVNVVFFHERHENRLRAQLIETCPTVY